MHGRDQFYTDNGLLGIGPQELEVGDEIVLFRDSDFMYAIRPAQTFGRIGNVENAYNLVGPVVVRPPDQRIGMVAMDSNEPAEIPKVRNYTLM